MSERLAELLREAADAPEPLQLQDIEQRVRRNHRRRIALATAVVTAVVAAVVVPMTVVPDHRGQAALTATPPPTPVANVVTYEHLSVTVPPGWRVVAGSFCNAPANRTVSFGAVRTTSCAEGPPQPPVTGIALLGYTDAAYIAESLVQPAEMTKPAQLDDETVLVDGQPATLYASHDGSDTVLTLHFRFLDAAASVSAPTEGAARALLARVSVDPASTLDVPAAAHSVLVNVTDGFQSLVVTTDPERVEAVVRALQGLPLEPVLEAQPCRAGTPIVVTVSGARGYGVVFGSCDQVVAGNGTLARATPQLKAALAAIVGAGVLR